MPGLGWQGSEAAAVQWASTQPASSPGPPPPLAATPSVDTSEPSLGPVTELTTAASECDQWQVRMPLAVLRCRASAGASPGHAGQLPGVRSGHVRAAAAPPPLLPRPHLLPHLLPPPQWWWLLVTPGPCLWYSPPRVPAAPPRCCCTLVWFQFPLLLNSPFAAAV